MSLSIKDAMINDDTFERYRFAFEVAFHCREIYSHDFEIYSHDFDRGKVTCECGRKFIEGSANYFMTVNGREVVDTCNCWNVHAKAIVGWLMQNKSRISNFFKLSADAAMKEAMELHQAGKDIDDVPF